MQTYDSVFDSARLARPPRTSGRVLMPPRQPLGTRAARLWRRLCDLSWHALKAAWLRLQPVLPGVPEHYWETTRAH